MCCKQSEPLEKAFQLLIGGVTELPTIGIAAKMVPWKRSAKLVKYLKEKLQSGSFVHFAANLNL